MLTKKIWVEKGFQTSINIAYDLHNDSKIKNFIPTLSSIDVIEDIMLSTAVQDRGRARILIGAYGKGKSHIVLVLMSLLFKKDIYLFSSLLEKIYEYKPELYDFIVDYIKSDKKLLPIIISGSSTSISQSFLSALQSALKNEGLADLMPETHFEAAVNAINLWRESYEDTYKKFLSEINVPINDFIVSLQEYDVNAYEKFVELYPALTSGSTFNPFIGHDIVELYEKVTEKLTERGYSGVYIVYDEFSKYLESSIANTTISDIKLLQDFAEKCDRSDDKQMHLMLISHKDIANYIDKKLPKDKVDGWRGVSGRFKHMSLHNNYAQIYEIISFVIRKEEGFWSDFCRDHQAKFEQLIERFIGNGVLDKDDEKTAEIAVKGCYPLHPVSTFILPRLSEKVAQNERTLFTFLSADSKNTLTDFLERVPEGFSLLTPDYLFDYFEPLLKKEPYTSDVHKLYTTTRKVLQKLENDSLAAKIIKTISLIYIVEQFEKLPPVKDIILCGRSNVGKSSFINTITNRRNLARVGQTPGKTRQIIFFNIDNRLRIVDMPGYGYAKVSKSEQNAWKDLTDEYFQSGRPIALALLFLDIRREPSEDDLLMMNWLAVNEIPYVIVAVKADKFAKTKVNTEIRRLKNTLESVYRNEIYPFSSLKKEGVQEFKAFLEDYLELTEEI
jgi:ribosome biogenesis GTP-binding protein YsxC/EngB